MFIFCIGYVLKTAIYTCIFDFQQTAKCAI